MVSVTFINAEMLWTLFAIPIIIALHFFLIRFTRRRAVLFANFEALHRVTGGVVFPKNITILILRVLTILLLCFSAAGLTLWFSGQGSEFNYILAIDASSSMLADDFDPNRLEVAKSEAGQFIDSLGGDVNIGVVSFSGVARTEIGLSPKRSDVSAAINDLKISEAGGTDITGALFTSVNLLLSDPDRYSSVILITDGQQTVGSPVEEAIDYALEHAVAVHTIGMATDTGGSFEMTDLVSTLDEETLKKIAEKTGGKFYKVSSADDLSVAFNAIVQITSKDIPHQLRLHLLLAAFVLFFVEWILANSRFKALP
jgi:Ca-activated chloride channel family protein